MVTLARLSEKQSPVCSWQLRADRRLRIVSGLTRVRRREAIVCYISRCYHALCCSAVSWHDCLTCRQTHRVPYLPPHGVARSNSAAIIVSANRRGRAVLPPIRLPWMLSSDSPFKSMGPSGPSAAPRLRDVTPPSPAICTHSKSPSIRSLSLRKELIRSRPCCISSSPSRAPDQIDRFMVPNMLSTFRQKYIPRPFVQLVSQC